MKAHALLSFRVENTNFAAAVVKNKYFLLDIPLSDTENLVADTGNAILKNALRKFRLKFKCPFQELPDHSQRNGCGVELKIDLVLSLSPYDVRGELGRQASEYDLCIVNDIANNVYMCGEYLIPSRHSQIWCTSDQLSSNAKPVSASTKSIFFQDSECR